MKNKEENQKLVPKLRFPEFRDAGEWERKKLWELLSEIKQRNRNLEYGPKDVLSVSGEYGCVNQIELMGRSYAGVSVKDYHIIKTGDIVYTKSPLKKNPFGIIKENKGKPGIVSTLYVVYRVTEMGHPAFIDHYFSRDYNLNSYLQPIVKKGAKNDMKVNNLAVLSGKILAPKIDEQKEISACLSSLDYQISSHIKKLVALKRYKKGLAQQLFPIEGENVPRLRFPDFRNTNEWQETILGNLVKISTGKKNTQDRVENGKYPFFVRSDTIERINSYSFDGEAILTAGDGVGVGKVFHYINGRFDIHQRVYKLTNFCNKIIGRFLFEEFRKNFKKRVFQMSAKNSVDSIRMEMLFEMPILFPSIPEQIKISNCLSSLDELITAQYKKIESLKMHKNSLMQQLFPNVTEKV